MTTSTAANKTLADCANEWLAGQGIAVPKGQRAPYKVWRWIDRYYPGGWAKFADDLHHDRLAATREP